jgi:hypothetical protein
MDPRLDFFLNRVAGRLQRWRLGWYLALGWCLAAITIPLIGRYVDASRQWLVYAALLAAILSGAWWIARYAYRDRRRLATMVEQVYPDLDQRLVTSVGVHTQSASSFLRRALIDETILHAATHDWRQVISRGRMLFAWSVQSLAMGLACAVLAFTIAPGNAKDQPRGSRLPFLDKAPAFTVEPGDAEVERGTDCLVTVRYESALPAEARLLFSSAAQPPAVQELKRSLRDPVFAGYLEKLDSDTTYRIETDQGVSRDYTLKVFDYPALVRSDAAIAPPTYAGQAPRRVRDTRRITVPEGSSITWTCIVNKPLAAVQFLGVDDEAVEFTPDSSDPLQFHLELVADQNQQWKLRLEDQDGRRAKVEETFVVTVIKNQPPQLTSTDGGDLVVSPLEEIAVTAKVREDFGVVRAGIDFQMAGGDLQSIVLRSATAEVAPADDEESPPPQASKSPGETLLEHTLDFEALRAEPDQLLSYYFWAEDRDRHDQLRRVESEIFFAEVRPYEEIFRQGQAPSGPPSPSQSQQAQQAEELAELQKKIMAGSWNLVRRQATDEPRQKLAEDLEVLIASQAEALALTDPLEEKIQDPQSKQHLEAARQAMSAASRALETTRDIAASSKVDKPLPNEPAAVDRDRWTTELKGAMAQEQAAYEALLRLRAREHQIVKAKQPSSAKANSAAKRNRQQQIEQLKLDEEEERYESQQTAATEEEAASRETRQVMNRLEELARRQQDLNRQLKDLETALQEAKEPEKKAELEEQLKRLRDHQDELLRDADELLNRMQEAANEAAQAPMMQQAQQQVEQARENVRQASEALAQGQPSASQALSAGTRAERQLSETREQLRQQSAEQFADAMRSMLDQAKTLEEQQQKLSEQTLNPAAASGKDQAADGAAEGGLRPGKGGEPPDETKREEAWQAQRQQLGELLNRMQETIAEAEPVEPLLAEKLYETYRETRQAGVEERLALVPRLIERGFEAPVSEAVQQIDRGLQQLRSGIETAADAVLGSEREGLRRALEELDQAERQLQRDLAESSRGNRPPGDAQGEEPKAAAANAAVPAEAAGKTEAAGQPLPGTSDRPEARGAEPASEGSAAPRGNRTPQGPTPASPRDNESRSMAADARPSPAGEPSTTGQPEAASAEKGQGQPTAGRPPRQAEAGASQAAGRAAAGQPNDGRGSLAERMPGLSGRGADENLEGPFTGNNFVGWSDALREVEESVRDPELRASASAIREAARELHRDAKRHAGEPRWDLVKEMVAKPLARLREQVELEWLRQTADQNAVVPLDRDPVPTIYENQLQKYYENLSSRPHVE